MKLVLLELSLLSICALCLSDLEAVRADAQAPLGTGPLPVDGQANYAFAVLQGSYYLGMATKDKASVLQADLTQDSQLVVSKQVSYWGARRLDLSSGEYELSLNGFGAVIIASDAQRQGSYHFEALSIASFFLLPQGPILNIDIALETTTDARLVVYDGLLSEVLMTTIAGGAEATFEARLDADRADFAYVVITSPGGLIRGTYAWTSDQSFGSGPPRILMDLTILVVVVAVLVLVLSLRLRRPRSVRRPNRRR